jgi:hypothetical protein
MGEQLRELYALLTKPGERFPALANWLLENVWLAGPATGNPTAESLITAETEVNCLEAVVAAAAPRTYDELCFPADPEHDLLHFLLHRRPCAAVVFDGLSLREIPPVLSLAARSHLRVVEVGCSLAAYPSVTAAFIAQRLRLPNCSPSQLPERKTLREQGIAAYYYSSPTQQHSIDNACHALFLWSAFPDNTYRDSGARFPNHFAEIHSRLEIAWRFTVQQIPRDRVIVITSDHGYVFFWHGLSATRHNEAIRPLTRLLGGERFLYLEGNEPLPTYSDLVVKQTPDNRRVAMIRGRVQTHPPGDAATKLYKHGGLSLMEMLTPWIVLEAEG